MVAAVAGDTTNGGRRIAGGGRLHARVLGPVEVSTPDGARVELPRGKGRILLVALLVSPGETVSNELLMRCLWGDRPPAAGNAALATHVTKLRRRLDPLVPSTTSIIERRPDGWAIDAARVWRDLDELEELIDAGDRAERAGDLVGAAETFETARRLARGTPFVELAESREAGWVASAGGRAMALVAEADERHVDVLLASGRCSRAVREVEALVADWPGRPRHWVQLAEALVRCGRVAETARVRDAARSALAAAGTAEGAQARRLERFLDELPPDPPPGEMSAATGPGVPTSSAAGAGTDPVEDAVRERVVGRADELARIGGALADARAGLGSIVLLKGGPGMGRSHLATEVVGAARAHGFSATAVRCADAVDAPLLDPWVRALQQLGRVIPDTDPCEGADHDLARYRRILRILDELAQAGTEAPVLVVLDDVHHSDNATMQAVRMLASRIHREPVVVVATVRVSDPWDHGPLSILLSELHARSAVTRVRLGPLDDVAAAELVAGVVRRPLEPRMVERIVASGRGNPLRLASIARLVDAGADPPETDTLPDSGSGIVRAWLDLVPDGVRKVLCVSALFREWFRPSVVASVCGVDAETVTATLAKMVDAGFLEFRDDGAWMRFTHRSVREHLADVLSSTSRARLHAEFAAAIEVAVPPGHAPPAAELAFHHLGALALGHAASAVKWCRIAADEARSDGRWEVAARFVRAAIDAAEGVDELRGERVDALVDLAHDELLAGDGAAATSAIETALGLVTRAGDDRRAARIALELGWMRPWSTRVSSTLDLDLAMRLERVALDDSDAGSSTRLLSALGVELSHAPFADHGARLLRTAFERSNALGDPDLIAHVNQDIAGSPWLGLDGEEQRLAVCRAVLERRATGLPTRSELLARYRRILIALRRADIDTCREDYARCQGLLAGMFVPDFDARLRHVDCTLSMLAGRWTEADALSQLALEAHAATSTMGADFCRYVQLATIRTVIGGPVDFLDGMVRLAHEPRFFPLRAPAVLLAARSGDLEQAEYLWRRWDWRDEPGDWGWSHLLPDWTDAAVLLERYDDVAELLARVEPRHRGRIVVAGSALACRGPVDLVTARARLVLGDLEGARADRDRALELCRRIGATWWEEHVRSELPFGA